MRVYTFYTPSHQSLFEGFFLPSVPKWGEVVPLFSEEQACTGGDFRTGGWRETQIKKVSYWIEAVDKGMASNDIILGSDVDCQFFNLSEQEVENLIGNDDVAFQFNGGEEMLCSGFFICRCNERSKQMFEAVKQTMLNDSEMKGEQIALNRVLGATAPENIWKEEIRHREIMEQRSALPVAGQPIKSWWKRRFNAYPTKPKVDVRWSVLPYRRFWHPGRFYDTMDEIEIPQEVRFHHAIYTVGVPSKTEQLSYVQKHLKSI